MKAHSLLFASLLLAVTGFAQTAPPPPVEITSIVPSTAPLSGGTEVTITGSGFAPAPGFACILPCPLTVTFGGSQAAVREESDKRLVVVAPPHSAGTVDVTVTTSDGRKATATNAFTYSSSTTWEKVLIPIVLDAPLNGAAGSVWETDLWMRNTSENAITVAPWPCDPGKVCPAIYPLTRDIAAGELVHNPKAGSPVAASNPARLLYVGGSSPSALKFQLRVGDTSRQTLDAGTELQVVREREFATTPVELLNIPLSGRFRVLIRVYDAAMATSQFRVTVFAMAEGAPTTVPITQVVLVALPPTTTTTTVLPEFAGQPAYAEYGGLSLILMQPTIFPPLVRVRIEPLTAGSRFWAFASITNNETQHVTTVTPQ